MAKKQTVPTNILAKTTRPAQDPEADQAEREAQAKKKAAARRRPVGVYLRVATRAEIEKIARETDLPLHAVLAYAVTYFVRQYKAGKAKIETVKKTTLNMDV